MQGSEGSSTFRRITESALNQQRWRKLAHVRQPCCQLIVLLHQQVWNFRDHSDRLLFSPPMVVRGLSDLENQSANSQNSRNGGVPSMALGQLLPSIPEILFPDLRLRSFIGIITLVDIAAFIITLLVGQFAYDGAFVKENDNVGPSVRTLSAVGGMDTSLIVNKYQLWRYVIPIILHAGLKHIGFNLFFQGSIGFRYETLWGTKHMALIYWIGGLAGTVLSALLNRKVVSVGASGALMGLLGAIIAFIAFNWKDLPDAPQRMCNVVMLLVLNALFGISSTGIDNWAHLGGVIGGGLAGTAFLKKSPMTATVKNVQTGAGFALAFYFIICLVVTFTSSPA